MNFRLKNHGSASMQTGAFAEISKPTSMAPEFNNRGTNDSKYPKLDPKITGYQI